MGVVQFEELKIRQQEIEVRALVALMKKGNYHWRIKAERRLAEIAFPELLSDYINDLCEQTTLEKE
jgi:hypothetical protein